ncbi:hypothetical protein A8F94_18885 [Bacillus sp. FJAT-27225]|uniref:hypothetical protein n=1 Tax=Bacillus sp. FJAT-27225 TaxID=1743144 RepID=UPI00080C20B2|nr:hypothetical protein [Bacillus sp. FJAT-27225]OCA83183.1 hypothetical protein A8F94_18885 [Bacillus sp. FJAT-27225]
MFSWDDLHTFAWAFFVVLPIVAFIHAFGHVFFVYLFGGKADLTVGRGRKIFTLGRMHFFLLYFIDAACAYTEIKNGKRWKHALIYAGGVIFNGLTILIVNLLIIEGILPTHQFFYQLGYFSLYYIFFALLPVNFGEDNPSDGIAIYLALRYGYSFKEFD